MPASSQALAARPEPPHRGTGLNGTRAPCQGPQPQFAAPSAHSSPLPSHLNAPQCPWPAPDCNLYFWHRRSGTAAPPVHRLPWERDGVFTSRDTLLRSSVCVRTDRSGDFCCHSSPARASPARASPRASVSPRSCVAEATAGFASTHVNLGFVCFPSKTPTFCHFSPGDNPFFPTLQSRDGLCAAPSRWGARAGIGAGLSP